MKRINIFYLVLILVVLGFMVKPFMNEISDSRLKENHCLEEKSFYYRIEGGLFTKKVKTNELNSDGIEWKCIRWEEELFFGKIFLGQKLIYEKGTLKAVKEVVDE